MRSLFLIALCCLLASCGYSCRDTRGTVLEVTNFEAPPEQWKFRPIQGAEIAVYWEGYKPLYSHGGRNYCLAIVQTTSDSDGHFDVEGRRVPRAVGGITQITSVSLAFVPGFVELRPHEHKSSVWGDQSAALPVVHVFRRGEDPRDPDVRAAALSAVKFCPSEEFSRGH
jgi:hypothetical protein